MYLQTRFIMASKCISKLAGSWPPTVSLDLNHYSLQVRTITASKYFSKEQRQVYRNVGVMEVQRVTGSIYSADPRVYRYHPISIASCHTMKIHILSIPTFGLTRSVRDFVDPQRWRLSSLLIRFLNFVNQMSSLSWIPF